MDRQQATSAKWEPPAIVEIGALPSALGDCSGGSTQTTPATCGNGQNTGTDGHVCSNGGTTLTHCKSGSAP